MQPLTRVTPATIDVLQTFVESSDALWGLRVIKESGRPAGSVYPILERLESVGWVASRWEDDNSRSGPRRRYYELTDGGAVAARAAIATFVAARRPKAAPNVIATSAVTA
ncbi:PadR family transcriptional regulator [Rhodoglobus sp. NPDC076762]